MRWIKRIYLVSNIGLPFNTRHHMTMRALHMKSVKAMIGSSAKSIFFFFRRCEKKYGNPITGFCDLLNKLCHCSSTVFFVCRSSIQIPKLQKRRKKNQSHFIKSVNKYQSNLICSLILCEQISTKYMNTTHRPFCQWDFWLLPCVHDGTNAILLTLKEKNIPNFDKKQRLTHGSQSILFFWDNSAAEKKQQKIQFNKRVNESAFTFA